MLKYLTTKELAELLRIKERKVYDLAASGAVPCSKAMGKLLFSWDGVDDAEFDDEPTCGPTDQYRRRCTTAVARPYRSG
jgi:excisionase family DNA binding protein